MECIFCQIVAGRVPAFVVDENEAYVAFLDIYPARTGQVVVASKAHWSSDVLELEEGQRAGLVEFAARVSKQIKQGLGCERCILVAEGLGVDHAHIKLYPVNKEKEFGLVPSGEKASEEELQLLATKLKTGKGE